MTAGAGVVHEEKHGREFSQQGGTLEMIQLWVNLPQAHKMTRPRYQEISAAQIPEVSDAGSTVRVIAGNYQDYTGPAQTFTPLTMLDLRLAANARLEVPTTDGYNTAVYVLRGSLRANGAAVGEAELFVAQDVSSTLHLEADTESTVLLLSGEPINEPVASYGPFVMNNSQELMQAMQDYEQGKMGTLTAEIL
jgi:redox-sensitive bicupin YhaK (pirin superfamily)